MAEKLLPFWPRKRLLNYVICTSQRSGKTWLATTLRDLGYGYADEFVTALLRKQLGLDAAYEVGGLPGFVQRAKDLQSGRSYGAALAWNDFAKLANRAELEPRALFDQILMEMGEGTAIIFLRRADILAQAISHYLLTRTGYRHSFDDEEKKIARNNVLFDRAAIEAEIKFAEKAYRGWENVLMGRSYYCSSYESLVSDPVTTVGAIVRLIGGHASDRSIRKSLKLMTKVGDQKNDEFRAEFLRTQ